VVIGIAPEGAEGAAGVADVRVVDVAVDDVGADLVAMDGAAAGVGVAAEGVQGHRGEEVEGLLGVRRAWPEAMARSRPGSAAWRWGVLGVGGVDGHGAESQGEILGFQEVVKR